ncbi:alpha/beta hydrolase [Bermanella marisrubri]|uniref:Esterase/lipase/thioesterase family protein n=1 Tax=Bermanella marisrubri TaxID=207949 RepID=Q1MXZ9_9GAMM|nr:alpha/beta fold hydrolase [Bermanella marisrubri]EAT10830.1 esterase/lipase/thioesterase family protein [Oceanobacter sp. RED65] [Bermanella marisrubri]QIZ84212.1 alpha/beta hydrolase [Bermanella marisrubri]
MKSSSDLFPVSLMKADVLDDTYIEDTYLLKPNNSPDQTVQIAVTRLGYYNSEGARGMPVILFHGAFSNRSCWMQPEEQGVAKTLLDNGFDPWMVDLRGHGDSPVNQQYQNNSLEAYAQFDLPAIQAFVYEKTGQPSIWTGHSWGGVLIATAVAGKYLDESKIKALVLLGSQVTRYPFALRVPFLRITAKIIATIKHQHFAPALGPEAEPKGVAKEFIRWSSLWLGWRDSKKQALKKSWKATRLPILSVAASRDRSDPPKHCRKLINWVEQSVKKDFIVAGKASGFDTEYSHRDLIASSKAQTELWPRIIHWLKEV